ncbi:uncharacterized protein 1i [SARS coronavirus ZJ0301]|uniref:Uncharacterized protein 1i n=1 Tax=SARS coronavirus ZJ0301 TaxID=344702 RepID=Q3S2D6_SARS|nr:uncharacterized protein 1i [SARS coronavirus ZJ0301]
MTMHLPTITIRREVGLCWHYYQTTKISNGLDSLRVMVQVQFTQNWNHLVGLLQTHQKGLK